VSKGGLLYHFPSKDHLVAAMIQRLIDTIEEARTRERAKLPPGPARELKAYLLAWLHEDPKLRKIAAGLLAAAAHNPSLMADAKKHFHSMYDQFLAGGLSPERASVVFMAAEGFRFFELMGMVELTPERRQIVVDELIGLIEG
jgi:AcrR family transcriptional regulator